MHLRVDQKGSWVSRQHTIWTIQHVDVLSFEATHSIHSVLSSRRTPVSNSSPDRSKTLQSSRCSLHCARIFSIVPGDCCCIVGCLLGVLLRWDTLKTGTDYVTLSHVVSLCRTHGARTTRWNWDQRFNVWSSFIANHLGILWQSYGILAVRHVRSGYFKVNVRKSEWICSRASVQVCLPREHRFKWGKSRWVQHEWWERKLSNYSNWQAMRISFRMIPIPQALIQSKYHKNS